MNLEIGKMYKTKNGGMVGPCMANITFNYLYDCEDKITGNTWTYTEDGKGVGLDTNSGFHIIAEWTEADILEKPVKKICDMTLLDYRRGVDKIWNSMRPSGA